VTQAASTASPTATAESPVPTPPTEAAGRPPAAAPEPPRRPSAAAPEPPRTAPARRPASASDGSSEIPLEAARTSPVPTPAAPTTQVPAAPTTPRPTTSASDPALAELLAAWPAIVSQLSENPPTKPLITKCRPVSIEGNIVTLGFPEEQAFLRDAAERRRPKLEEGIGEFLGRPVGIRCVATNLDLLPPLPPDDDAARILDEARRIFADDLAAPPEVS